MSSITKDQIVIKRSVEETLAWSRVVRFEWMNPGLDKPELVVIKFYHSDFDGYDIDWGLSDCSPAFKYAVESDNELAELLDSLTWNFVNE